MFPLQSYFSAEKYTYKSNFCLPLNGKREPLRRDSLRRLEELPHGAL
jgi:hypothetical protein